MLNKGNEFLAQKNDRALPFLITWWWRHFGRKCQELTTSKQLLPYQLLQVFYQLER